MAEPRKRKRSRKQAPQSNEVAENKESSVEPPVETAEAEVVAERQEPVGEAQSVGTESNAGQDYPGLDYQGSVVGQANGTGIPELLQDQEFMDGVITEMVASRTMDRFAEEIADEVCQILEDSPEFRWRLIESAMSSDQAKEKMIRALIKALR